MREPQTTLASGKPPSDLPRVFRDSFGTEVPEKLNAKQRLLIVASEFDDSSRRIVQYLANVHAVDINTAFFEFFRDNDREFVTADWLMDEDEVRERSEARTRAPWSGDWYANVGDGPSRSWEDCRRYGFLAAGNGTAYSDPLKRLDVGAIVFAYQPGAGYVGYGIVNKTAGMAKDFTVDGKSLLDLPLDQPNLAHDRDDPEQAEYLAGIDWKRTFPITEAKWTAGLFSNPNVAKKFQEQEINERVRYVCEPGDAGDRAFREMMSRVATSDEEVRSMLRVPGVMPGTKADFPGLDAADFYVWLMAQHVLKSSVITGGPQIEPSGYLALLKVEALTHYLGGDMLREWSQDKLEMREAVRRLFSLDQWYPGRLGAPSRFQP